MCVHVNTNTWERDSFFRKHSSGTGAKPVARREKVNTFRHEASPSDMKVIRSRPASDVIGRRTACRTWSRNIFAWNLPPMTDVCGERARASVLPLYRDRKDQMIRTHPLLAGTNCDWWNRNNYYTHFVSATTRVTTTSQPRPPRPCNVFPLYSYADGTELCSVLPTTIAAAAPKVFQNILNDYWSATERKILSVTW